jgi:hypothetical protein
VNYQKSINTIFIFRRRSGDPLVGDGSWDTKYYELIDALTKWNLENPVKSMCCLFVIPFRWLANILAARNHERNDTSFGVMKMHKTVEGQTDSLLERSFLLLTPGITSGTTQVKCL